MHKYSPQPFHPRSIFQKSTKPGTTTAEKSIFLTGRSLERLVIEERQLLSEQSWKGSQGRRCRVSVLQRVITNNGQARRSRGARLPVERGIRRIFMRARNERRFAYSMPATRPRRLALASQQCALLSAACVPSRATTWKPIVHLASLALDGGEGFANGECKCSLKSVVIHLLRSSTPRGGVRVWNQVSIGRC